MDWTRMAVWTGCVAFSVACWALAYAVARIVWRALEEPFLAVLGVQ